MSIRIAHISDLHFFSPSFNPLQFFSKRCLGNINFLFSRRKEYDTGRLPSLIPHFKQQGITHVLISGDLTTTSFAKEFQQAADFIEKLKKENITVFTLPGNHDHYTRRAYRKKLFYRFFPEPDLKDNKIAVHTLSPKWKLVLLDTALATSWVSSRGNFSPEMEKSLDETLQSIPRSCGVILANHFPFFHNDSQRKILLRGDSLRHLLARHPHVAFYLHGHTHRQILADLRKNHLPIILDSGSTSRADGGWNLVKISDKSADISLYSWDQEWKVKRELSVALV